MQGIGSPNTGGGTKLHLSPPQAAVAVPLTPAAAAAAAAAPQQQQLLKEPSAAAVAGHGIDERGTLEATETLSAPETAVVDATIDVNHPGASHGLVNLQAPLEPPPIAAAAAAGAAADVEAATAAAAIIDPSQATFVQFDYDPKETANIQVNFMGQNQSEVRRSVCLSVRPSVLSISVRTGRKNGIIFIRFVGRVSAYVRVLTSLHTIVTMCT